MTSLASSLVLFGNTPSSGIITQINASKGTNPANETFQRGTFFVRKEWLGCDVGRISCGHSRNEYPLANSGSNKNFDWHTVLPEQMQGMQWKLLQMWYGQPCKPILRWESRSCVMGVEKSNLHWKKVRFLLPVRQVHQTLIVSKGQNQWRCFGCFGWDPMEQNCFIPSQVQVMSLGCLGDEFTFFLSCREEFGRVERWTDFVTWVPISNFQIEDWV